MSNFWGALHPNVSLSLYYLIKISVGIIMTGIGIYMLRKDKKSK